MVRTLPRCSLNCPLVVILSIFSILWRAVFRCSGIDTMSIDDQLQTLNIWALTWRFISSCECVGSSKLLTTTCKSFKANLLPFIQFNNVKLILKKFECNEFLVAHHVETVSQIHMLPCIDRIIHLWYPMQRLCHRPLRPWRVPRQHERCLFRYDKIRSLCAMHMTTRRPVRDKRQSIHDWFDQRRVLQLVDRQDHRVVNILVEINLWS